MAPSKKSATPSSKANWIKQYASKEDADVALFCFPHAGGGPQAFRDWQFSQALVNADVFCVSPPGRGERFNDAIVSDIGVMVNSIVEAIKPNLNLPFGFFGHSLGALIAHKVAIELRRLGLPLPSFLIASASEAPATMTPADTNQSLSDLGDTEFIEKIGHQWGFIDKSVLDDGSLMDVILPALRADIEIWESFADFNHVTDELPLDLPVLAIGGDADTSITKKQLDDWEATTTGDFSVKTFGGDHFYLAADQSQSALLSALTEFINGQLQALPAAVLLGPQIPHADFEKCVHEIFNETAARIPDKEAVVGLNRNLTYAQLAEESTLLARQLQQFGVHPEQSVGIYIPHAEEYIIANLAVFKAGGAMFLIETSYTQDLIAEFIAAGNVSIVLTCEELVDNLPKSSGLDIILLDGTEWVAKLAADTTLPDLISPALTPKSVAYNTMTSGSTGKPKVVVNDHLGAVTCFFGRFDLYPYTEGEREGLNVFFAWECLRALIAGQTAVVIPDSIIFDPKRLLAYIRKNRITRVMVTPSLMGTILDSPGIDLKYFLGHMHAWYMEGEVLPMRIATRFAERVPGVKMLNVYSSWEALDNTYADVTDPKYSIANSLSKFASAGTPMPYVQVYICDENLNLKRVGQPGELYIGTPAMFHGYKGDPEKTASRLIESPWAGCHSEGYLGGNEYVHSSKLYRSGDRGRVRPDGQLEVLGRADSTVKIRGFKVSFGMVEQCIADLPNISQVVVTAKLDPSTKQAIDLIAYVVGIGKVFTSAEALELKLKLATILPDYAVPVYWVPLKALPQKGGESRKVDRQRLPTPFPEHRMVQSVASDGVVTHSEASFAVDAQDSLLNEICSIFKSVLNDNDLGSTDNFFDAGGHSLLAATLVGELNNLGISFAITDLYQYPTPNDIAGMLKRAAEPSVDAKLSSSWRESTNRAFKASKIAIIGMAGEFPGAPNVPALWQLLKSGSDAVTRLSSEDYAGKNIAPSIYQDPNWVPAIYSCPDAAKFDAGFFGIGPKEAEIMDPQHRRFMQCAWEAVEVAGYAPRTGSPRNTAVYAAAGVDGYLHHHFDGEPLKKLDSPGDIFLGEVGSEKDYIATRVSFALDMSGPSVNVNSACSSGLVAVAQAAQSLQTGNCDMAVAGASSISFPNFGYMYGEGLVGAKDGKVRPFDADASGTLFGDSVGAVVLKRLEDAERDGDIVLAVLGGSAITNDGARKAAYAAPSALAQETAILMAQQQAGVEACDVSYVECHATATLLGDGIELSGLAGAFSKNVSIENENQKACPCEKAMEAEPSRWCALGSIKGNIGHANCAAGITGLIKAILCLHHKTLVPTVHFKNTNPKLGLDRPDRSPFYIHEDTRDWVLPAGIQKRICGVSSFGIGGTNCHVVLEEHKQEVPAKVVPPLCGFEILTFSAKSVTSLRGGMQKMIDYLRSNPSVSLAAVADVMHRSREEFQFRISVVASSVNQAVHAIGEAKDSLNQDTRPAQKNAKTIFVFPGQGSQFLRMGHGLYEGDTAFTKHFDELAGLVTEKASLERDLQAVLFQPAEEFQFTDPVLIQTCIFITEVALARTLIGFGIEPTAVAGHSIGEYAAATISGIITPDAAIDMILLRATSARDDCTAGGMLSASLSGEDARTLVDEINLGISEDDYQHRVYLACDNDPERVVFSGTKDVLERLKQVIDSQGEARFGRVVKLRELHVTNGFHSELMKPMADKVSTLVDSWEAQDSFSNARYPVTSNVTGGWMDEEVRSGGYWASQIVGTVKWVENVHALLRWNPHNIVEVGPGTTLNFFINQILKSDENLENKPDLHSAMRHAKAQDENDANIFASLIGQLWQSGVSIDWDSFHSHHGKQHLPDLPTYAWNESICWFNPGRSIYEKETNKQVAHRKKIPKKSLKKNSTKPAPVSDMLVRYASRSSVRRSPSVRLYCFTYAGGSSRTFEPWANSDSCPSWLEVVAIEMPMRGTRSDETTRSSTDSGDRAEVVSLATEIASDLTGLPDMKVSLCGMSMGALNAIEVAHKLIELGYGHQLVGLTIAGRALPIGGVSSTSYDMNELNLAGEEITKSEAWETYLKPLLEADLIADARAASRVADVLSAEEKLDIDIQVHCGISDGSFPFSTATQWQNLQSSATNAKFDVNYYPEGHGFLVDRSLEIFSKVCGSLERHGAKSKVEAVSSVLSRVEWIPNAIVPQIQVSTIFQGAPMYLLGNNSGCSTDLGIVDISEQNIENLVTMMKSETGLVLAVGNNKLSVDDQLKFELEESWRFIQLLQKIVALDGSGRVVLVGPASSAGAMTMGASKALALEYPDVKFLRIFNESFEKDFTRVGIAKSLQIASSITTDTDIWLKFTRNGEVRILAPRVQPVPVRVREDLQESSLLNSNGNYLITGGTGGIGSAVVSWLISTVGLRAETLTVLCRNSQSKAALALASKGVNLVELDCSDIEGVRSNSALSSLERVDGIFHLAGVLEDSLVSNLTRDMFDRVVNPKALGIASLISTAELRGWQPDFILNFSSTSSLLGYPGQSNYCAGNAFLDQLSTWGCRGTRLNANVTTINWGPWGEAGMAGPGTKAHAQALKDSDHPLSNHDALSAFAEVLSSISMASGRSSEYMVCDVDWQKSPWREHPLIKNSKINNLARNNLGMDVDTDDSTFLDSGNSSERSTDEIADDDIELVLRRLVPSWSLHETLPAVGLDSLDIVQMRTAVNRELSLGVPLSLFNRPNQTLGELLTSLRKERK